ncbi:MAG: methyltransferase family protein [Anaerolineales bacterium]
MERSILLTTVLAQLLLIGSLVLTLRVPTIRVWPPPRRRSWQYVFTWGLTLVSFAGILLLGFLDWNSFVLEHCLRLPVGLGLIVSSIVLVVWAIRTLGIHASQGLGGKLVTDGPYGFTRNPQYVADIAMLAGFAVLSNSLYAWITCLLGMGWFFLAPLTEEPWLREQFGEYDQYVKSVPRFLELGRIIRAK